MGAQITPDLSLHRLPRIDHAAAQNGGDVRVANVETGSLSMTNS
jgi:hypothetical protein